MWPGQSANGRSIRIGSIERTVIGVVNNLRSYPVKSKFGRLGVRGNIFVPVAQERGTMPMCWLVVRVGKGGQNVAEAVRHQVYHLDSTQPVFDIRSMVSRVKDMSMGAKMYALLAGGFAAISLFLTAAGVYGITRVWIISRMRELGIRVAHGAERRDIISIVLRAHVIVVLVGWTVGILGSLIMVRLLESQLYDVAPTDIVTNMAASGGLWSLAIVSAVIPAWRMSRIDPMAILRQE
jgi:putative ABC transport system permease protein